VTISPIRVRATAKRTITKFGMRGRVADVIICFKFYRNRLRGSRALRGQKWGSFIDFDRRPYNRSALPCCLWVQVRYISASVRLSVCRLSVVCNVGAPYSDDWNFRQCVHATWYLGHLWPFGKNFTEIVPGEPFRRGLNQRGVEKCSDFGPFQGYISETVKDRR